MSNWPKHQDGSNKTIGEMTPKESRQAEIDEWHEDMASELEGVS